jgi:hypothetical protein
MNKQSFDVGKMRYTPGPVVRFNGVRGRFWRRQELTQGCWVFCGQRFHGLRANHSEISGAESPVEVQS